MLTICAATIWTCDTFVPLQLLVGIYLARTKHPGMLRLRFAGI